MNNMRCILLIVLLAYSGMSFGEWCDMLSALANVTQRKAELYKEMSNNSFLSKSDLKESGSDILEGCKDLSTTIQKAKAEQCPDSKYAEDIIRKYCDPKYYAMHSPPPKVKPKPKPKPKQNSNSSGFNTHINYSIDGKDLKVIRGITKNQCETKCKSSRACNAYTFDRWNKVCFLKHSTGTLRLEPKAVSGLRSDNSHRYSAASVSMVRYRGKKFPNSGYKNHTVNSFNDCEESCANDRKCVAFSYFKHNNSCVLIDNPDEYHSKRGVDSGAKRQ